DAGRMMSLPSSLATHTARALTRLTPLTMAASIHNVTQRCGSHSRRLRPPGGGWAVSELGQFGGRCQNALHGGAEIDEQGGSLFDTGDRAEAVLVVGDPVAYCEPLGGRLGIGSVERAGCQVTPGPGGVGAHCHQYAPACGAGRKESS